MNKLSNFFYKQTLLFLLLIMCWEGTAFASNPIRIGILPFEKPSHISVGGNYTTLESFLGLSLTKARPQIEAAFFDIESPVNFINLTNFSNQGAQINYQHTWQIKDISDEQRMSSLAALSTLDAIIFGSLTVAHDQTGQEMPFLVVGVFTPPQSYEFIEQPLTQDELVDFEQVLPFLMSNLDPSIDRIIALVQKNSSVQPVPVPPTSQNSGTQLTLTQSSSPQSSIGIGNVSSSQPVNANTAHAGGVSTNLQQSSQQTGMPHNASSGTTTTTTTGGIGQTPTSQGSGQVSSAGTVGQVSQALGTTTQMNPKPSNPIDVLALLGGEELSSTSSPTPSSAISIAATPAAAIVTTQTGQIVTGVNQSLMSQKSATVGGAWSNATLKEIYELAYEQAFYLYPGDASEHDIALTELALEKRINIRALKRGLIETFRSNVSIANESSCLSRDIISKPENQNGKSYHLCFEPNYIFEPPSKCSSSAQSEGKMVAMSFVEAESSINALQFYNWHIPTIEELLVLADYLPYPLAGEEPFSYWASTETADGNNWVLEVRAEILNSGSKPKTIAQPRVKILEKHEKAFLLPVLPCSGISNKP